jgi:hypothetical protein
MRENTHIKDIRVGDYVEDTESNRVFMMTMLQHSFFTRHPERANFIKLTVVDICLFYPDGTICTWFIFDN